MVFARSMIAPQDDPNEMFLTPAMVPIVNELSSKENKHDAFEEQLNALKQQVDPLLDDFMKQYILTQKNPEYEEYKTQFENTKAQIRTLLASIGKVKNSIDVETAGIDAMVMGINDDLAIQKEKYENIHVNLDRLKHSNNGSNIMIDNYKEIYRHTLLQKYALTIGMIALTIAIVMFCLPLLSTDKKTLNQQQQQQQQQDLYKRRAQGIA